MSRERSAGERAHRIEVSAEARPIEEWRLVAIAGQPNTGRFALVSDEGRYLPGKKKTAPTPLTYFVADVAL